MTEQGRQSLRRAPRVLSSVELLPDFKGIATPKIHRDRQGMPDHTQHLRDLLVQRLGGIFGEPLGREQVGGNADRTLSLRRNPEPDEQMRNLGHGRDAIPERHAGAQISQVKIVAFNLHRGHGRVRPVLGWCAPVVVRLMNGAVGGWRRWRSGRGVHFLS